MAAHVVDPIVADEDVSPFSIHIATWSTDLITQVQGDLDSSIGEVWHVWQSWYRCEDELSDNHRMQHHQPRVWAALFSTSARRMGEHTTAIRMEVSYRKNTPASIVLTSNTWRISSSQRRPREWQARYWPHKHMAASVLTTPRPTAQSIPSHFRQQAWSFTPKPPWFQSQASVRLGHRHRNMGNWLWWWSSWSRGRTFPKRIDTAFEVMNKVWLA